VLNRGKRYHVTAKLDSGKDSIDYSSKGKGNLQPRDCPFHEGKSERSSDFSHTVHLTSKKLG